MLQYFPVFMFWWYCQNCWLISVCDKLSLCPFSLFCLWKIFRLLILTIKDDFSIIKLHFHVLKVFFFFFWFAFVFVYLLIIQDLQHIKIGLCDMHRLLNFSDRDLLHMFLMLYEKQFFPCSFLYFIFCDTSTICLFIYLNIYISVQWDKLLESLSSWYGKKKNRCMNWHIQLKIKKTWSFRSHDACWQSTW